MRGQVLPRELLTSGGAGVADLSPLLYLSTERQGLRVGPGWEG